MEEKHKYKNAAEMVTAMLKDLPIIPKEQLEWEGRPVMLSLPKVFWLVLEDFMKNGNDEKELVAKDLVQEAILVKYGFTNPAQLAMILSAATVLLREKGAIK